ncbi:MAG: ArsA-related P-loop ATPase [Candidatus Nanopelagicales bacterium]
MSAPQPPSPARPADPGRPVAPGVTSQTRLHIVTGKGGTGKTTVAGALALALAYGGRKTLLMEVEGRQGLAHLFDTAPLPYAETRLAVAPGSGEVWGLAVDPGEALLDYLEMFYNLRRAGTALSKIGAVDFATTIAPGVRDVLLTGKAMEAVKRKRGDHPAYDAVILDAPPTGRITRFLNVNSEVAGIARVGPIHNQANSVMRVLRSPLTAVHLVTILEDMPVQETRDGVTELRSAGLPVGAVLVNMTSPAYLTPTQVEQVRAGEGLVEQVSEQLREADVAGPRHPELAPQWAESLLAEAAVVIARREQAEACRGDLAATGRPLVDLPLIPEGMDPGNLYVLARSLRAAGFGGGS